MDPLSLRSGIGPEKKIQLALIAQLELRGWYVKQTHGNIYQSGFPDLYAFHPKKGQRWIEVKVKERFAFTKAQKEWYPKFDACGVGIWVLMGYGPEDIALLDQKPNLREVMGGKFIKGRGSND